MVSDEIDITTAVIVVFLILLILLSGYLIIYNIFTISVTGDIRFYGLLKTIGATGKQLRRIVRGQALLLSLFGIPLGFLAGYLLGYGLSPVLINLTSIGQNAAATTANPLIFLFSGLFSLATIFISCRKPERIAARVSPVEALRYTEAPTGGKKEKRASYVSPMSMAWSNITRGKRKLIVITLSLSLSMILLNSVYSMVRGFDMEEYLRFMTVSDFSIADYSVYSPMVMYNDTNFEGVDNAALNEISQQPGIEDVANIYFYYDYDHKLTPQGHKNIINAFNYMRPDIEKNYAYSLGTIDNIIETGRTSMHIYGVGEPAVKAITDKPVDFTKLASGRYILATGYEDNEITPIYDVGDSVILKNEQGESREFEVLAIVSYPYPISCQFGSIGGGEIIMADQVYLDFYGDKQPMMTAFNVSDEYIQDTEEWLTSYCESVNGSLDYRSRNYYKAEFATMQNTFWMLGGALAFILALIGILNFINAIVTSIAARKRELAMLQSVGMTGTQLKTMLFGEGIVYALLTILFSITAGNLISRATLQVIAGQIWFFKWNFSIKPLLLAIPLLLAVCAVIPLICYHFMRRESVVERLRTE